MLFDEDTVIIDSRTMGDPGRFRSFEALDSDLKALPAAPADAGRLAFIMTRGSQGRRRLPERIHLTPDEGVPGDAWGRDRNREPEAQIAVMQLDVATLVANGQPLSLFGDCLILELDLSTENLPTGSRVRIGSAVLEVTPKPHNGCHKYRGRFGDGALRLVSNRELRHLNLRGVYMRVIEAGDAALGDPVEVIWRGAESQAFS